MLFSVSMFPVGSGDNLTQPVMTIAADEHRHAGSRLQGAIDDVDHELGRAVSR